MPVGRVFNAAANQVLISPVTNYYQGKAIRQAQEEKELDIELKKNEVKDAPSKREAAKRYALLQEENIRSTIDERVRKGEITELQLSAKE